MPLVRAASLLALCFALLARPSSADVSKELQDRINKAIDRGAAWVLTQWQEDGSFPAVQTAGGQAHFSIGTTSLVALSLLAAEVPPKADPRWERCISFLKALDGGNASASSRKVYDTGCLILFLTEYYGVKGGVKGKGTSAKINPCGLPDDVKAWVQDLATTLENSQLETGGWRYPQHPPADVSNTQYALLGLRAARDCGAVVRAVTFKTAAEWLLGLQPADGPKVPRKEGGTKPGEKEYVVDVDKARGWPYQTPQNPLTGSTTTAALSGLVICNDALLRPRFPAFDTPLEQKVRRSVQDGFAWLDLNFSVTRNVGGSGWLHSYLYGLERACLLAGREKLGKHDWYVLGAEHLLSTQAEDGKWSTGMLGPETSQSDVVDTAWALLFLKRAVKPAIPIKPPVVTPGGN